MNIFCAQHKFKLRLSQAFFNFDYHGSSFQEIAKLDKCRLNDYPFFNSSFAAIVRKTFLCSCVFRQAVIAQFRSS